MNFFAFISENSYLWAEYISCNMKDVQQGSPGHKNEKSLQRYMQLFYSKKLLLFFSIIPEHIDASCPTLTCA